MTNTKCNIRYDESIASYVELCMIGVVVNAATQHSCDDSYYGMPHDTLPWYYKGAGFAWEIQWLFAVLHHICFKTLF